MALETVSHSLVYCDGASKGNPGPGGWAALVLSPDQQVYELAGYAAQVTNNQMELQAAIAGLSLTLQWRLPVRILTDSSYVIHGITAWVWQWQRRGWLTVNGQPVANRELWEELTALARQQKVQWQHVRGHAGIAGNERVDSLASACALGQGPKLYAGPLTQYDLSEAVLRATPTSAAHQPSQPPRTGKKVPKAALYLSLVDGVFAKHATWAECAAKVQGHSGARFKKAHSPAEEEQIKKDWGLSS